MCITIKTKHLCWIHFIHRSYTFQFKQQIGAKSKRPPLCTTNWPKQCNLNFVHYLYSKQHKKSPSPTAIISKRAPQIWLPHWNSLCSQLVFWFCVWWLLLNMEMVPAMALTCLITCLTWLWVLHQPVLLQEPLLFMQS